MWFLAACAAPIDPPVGEAAIAPYDPLPLVDPRAGTGGLGAGVINLNPGPQRPWGMVQPGPDTWGATGNLSVYHCAGYHWDDDRIAGFSQTHGAGIGITDFGAVVLMPRDGWDPAWTTPITRLAPFSHDAEWATPGRYAVDLQDQDIHVDVTAAMHGAHWRFSWAPGATPVVVIDLGQNLDGTSIAEADLAVEGAEVSGFQRVLGGYSGRFGGLRTHFSLVVDPAPSGGGAWSDPAAPVAGATAAAGTGAGAWLEFPPGTPSVDVRIALSYVDVDGAHANRVAELPDLDFDARVAEAEADWRARLSSVRVAGGTEEDREIFTSSLYRSALMPRRYDDVDGRHRGPDDQIHPGGPTYSDLSLWDTFRTTHPWLILWQPEVQREILASLATMTAEGGGLPRWPMAHGNTGGMVGTPATQVIAESWAKGLDSGYDIDGLYAAALAAASGPVAVDSRGGMGSYLDLGWVSTDESGAAASQTLEYAWSDAALAGLAEGLGHTEDATRLREQSESWKNLWDPAQGFFVGRATDGTFGALLTPESWEDAFYTEGDAWHYRYAVPFDVGGMIEVQAGDSDAWLADLRAYWDGVAAEPDDLLPDAMYWHGNEPVLHTAWLASLAGDPELTSEAVDLVVRTRYATGPEALDGNDDGGTLSSWYLFAALGLYPIAGTDVYALGTPRFDRVEIDRPAGQLVVRTEGDGIYTASATLGDAPLPQASFRHADWEAAGELAVVRTPAR
jgi:predicted alpha-1,2-mannosidase